MSDFLSSWKVSSPLNPYSPVNTDNSHEYTVTSNNTVKPTPIHDLVIHIGPGGIQIMSGDSNDSSTLHPAVAGRDYIDGGVVGVPPPVIPVVNHSYYKDCYIFCSIFILYFVLILIFKYKRMK